MQSAVVSMSLIDECMYVYSDHLENLTCCYDPHCLHSFFFLTSESIIHLHHVLEIEKSYHAKCVFEWVALLCTNDAGYSYLSKGFKNSTYNELFNLFTMASHLVKKLSKRQSLGKTSAKLNCLDSSLYDY